MIHVSVLHPRNLPGYFNAVFTKFIEKSSCYTNNRQEPIGVFFGGDKWGSSTKLHFSIVAPGVTASAYDVKTFVIYVLRPFYNTIKIWNTWIIA